jgi:hypothetical protein
MCNTPPTTTTTTTTLAEPESDWKPPPDSQAQVRIFTLTRLDSPQTRQRAAVTTSV